MNRIGKAISAVLRGLVSLNHKTHRIGLLWKSVEPLQASKYDSKKITIPMVKHCVFIKNLAEYLP
jgi:hypothetical protein